MAASRAQPWRRSFTMRPKVMHSPAAMARMLSIWMKLEMGELFSKGWAPLALKKPPPLVPSILMAICEAAGPMAITWSARRVDVGREVLDQALGHEEEGENEGQGQQDVKGAAHQVHPGIAQARGAAARDAPDERHQHGNARGGGDKVLHSEAQHLGEVAQRGSPP